MNGLALITDMEYIKVGNKGFTPQGVKLSSQHVTYVPIGKGSNKRISVIDLYIDGLILRKGKPLMWQFDGGYVSLDDNGAPTSWNYYVTDHLGSTRMVVSSDNTVRETISYYPFGSEMKMQDPALMTGDFQHPYRFTGKELDRVNGLNMYDFGARWFDVAGVPMWTSVDPLCEKYYNVSPYVYCMNNPVILVDPNGMDWILSTGDKVYWYGGDVGDNSQLLYTYNATSGNIVERYDGGFNDYQEAKYQNLRDKGPTPEGSYYINLKVDPEREVRMNSNKQFLKSPEGGIESLVFTNPDTGMRSYYPAWGKNRASLTPVKVTGAKNSERDNNSYYFHDSEKGYTHGCTEVETSLFTQLKDYRNAGNLRIDVLVKYPSPNHKANGGTKK